MKNNPVLWAGLAIAFLLIVLAVQVGALARRIPVIEAMAVVCVPESAVTVTVRPDGTRVYCLPNDTGTEQNDGKKEKPDVEKN